MESEEFRDQLYNVDTSGRRVGFFPKRPKGRFFNARVIVSSVLLLIFFGIPWIKVGGEPFFMLDVIHRKFIIFGFAFWPQDFVLFAIFAVTFIIFIFLFTAILGRIWCGWACPQTIFLELVYRRIEFWIEGDYTKQRKLKAQEWNGEKIRKRLLKHSIFLLIAFLVSHTVISFFIGMDAVLAYVRDSPMEHPILFAFVLINTGAFYYVFSFFREQACIYMCPYGRLQGVMIDQNTLAVSYDNVRGEPRGKLKKNAEPSTTGDCIDCKLCVAVCPTGIDIRNGNQLECVACTACIDACDEVMDKIGKPRGLVRYASQQQIVNKAKFKLTPRTYLYIGVLTVLIGSFIGLMVTSGDLKMTLLRAPGQTYATTTNGNVTNLYSLSVVNKSTKDRHLDFRLHDSKGKITVLGAPHLELEGGKAATGDVLVELPQSEIKGMSFDLEIDVIENGEVVRTLSTSFSGPMF
ncbi:MAG TPA: cytochrome c oxidase accessory protein CcoG [Bacteroidia bacterium]|nr:cytochrome c oxidase accessory protein CcoG [Bacteroidia bacterium]